MNSDEQSITSQEVREHLSELLHGDRIQLSVKRSPITGYGKSHRQNRILHSQLLLDCSYINQHTLAPDDAALPTFLMRRCMVAFYLYGALSEKAELLQGGLRSDFALDPDTGMVTIPLKRIHGGVDTAPEKLKVAASDILNASPETFKEFVDQVNERMKRNGIRHGDHVLPETIVTQFELPERPRSFQRD